MKINDLFELGMKRHISELVAPGRSRINLGCGEAKLPDCVNLEWPLWDANAGRIPAMDSSVDTIFAFHFFEHLSPAVAIEILRDCQRVLRLGGQLNIVVPHRLSQMAWQDLDHKSVWCEETFRVLFSNPYYKKNRELPWGFRVNVNLIIGVVERNLALMTQLIRVEETI